MEEGLGLGVPRWSRGRKRGRRQGLGGNVETESLALRKVEVGRMKHVDLGIFRVSEEGLL